MHALRRRLRRVVGSREARPWERARREDGAVTGAGTAVRAPGAPAFGRGVGLPPDVVGRILSFLPAADLAHSRQVSRGFHAAASSQDLWARLLATDFHALPGTSTAMQAYSARAQSHKSRVKQTAAQRQIKESHDADERRKQLTAWYWVFYLLPRQSFAHLPAAEARQVGIASRVLALVLTLAAAYLMPSPAWALASAFLTFGKLWLYNLLHLLPAVVCVLCVAFLFDRHIHTILPNEMPRDRVSSPQALTGAVASGVGLVWMNLKWHVAPLVSVLWVLLQVVWFPLQLLALFVTACGFIAGFRPDHRIDRRRRTLLFSGLPLCLLFELFLLWRGWFWPPVLARWLFLVVVRVIELAACAFFGCLAVNQEWQARMRNNRTQRWMWVLVAALITGLTLQEYFLTWWFGVRTLRQLGLMVYIRGVLHVINFVAWVVDAVALPFGVGYWFWLPRWGPADLLRPPNVNFASLVSVGVVVVNVLLVGLSKLVGADTLTAVSWMGL